MRTADTPIFLSGYAKADYEQQNQWYVTIEGDAVGPVSTDLVVRGIKHKKIATNAFVCVVGASEWQSLLDVAEFYDALAEGGLLEAVPPSNGYHHDVRGIEIAATPKPADTEVDVAAPLKNADEEEESDTTASFSSKRPHELAAVISKKCLPSMPVRRRIMRAILNRATANQRHQCLDGRNGRVLVICVLVKPGVSGAQVLQAQAALLGYPSPRYAESGLLCAIDGYPTSGCGAQSGAHYAYWAYWHGGKRWQYANGGPGEWKVAKGDIEGWRFEPDGSATPADPPPRAPSSAAALEVPAGAAAVTTTSPPPSSGHATGPVGGGRKGTSPVPFVVSVAFILLIGAGAMLRSRRANGRAT